MSLTNPKRWMLEPDEMVVVHGTLAKIKNQIEVKSSVTELVFEKKKKINVFLYFVALGRIKRGSGN